MGLLGDFVGKVKRWRAERQAEPTAKGYHDVPIRRGMTVRSAHWDGGPGLPVVRVFRHTNEIEVLYEDGVSQKELASLYVPISRTRADARAANSLPPTRRRRR